MGRPRLYNPHRPATAAERKRYQRAATREKYGFDDNVTVTLLKKMIDALTEKMEEVTT